MAPRVVIAIDGPAASGKSSVARALARELGFLYVSSGALYRALTWHLLERGIAADNDAAVAAEAERVQIACGVREGEAIFFLDGKDPAAHLRDERVNSAVSIASRVPTLREVVGAKLREYAREHDVVVEGRDIGSVVFPDTPFKFYIDAALEVRAGRRAAEGQHDAIALRDLVDSSRQTAPLVIASDAVVIDSSHLSIDEVVTEILRHLEMRGFGQRVRE